MIFQLHQFLGNLSTFATVDVSKNKKQNAIPSGNLRCGSGNGIFHAISRVITWEPFRGESQRMQRYTPPKTNIEPENGPLEKEIPIGNHHFQVPC